MTISGEALALSATTSATLAVATNHLPMWVLIAMGLLGGTLSIIRSKTTSRGNIAINLVTGAIASAGLTNFIVDFLFEGHKNAIEFSIIIALILGVLGHVFFERLWRSKEEIGDAIEQKVKLTKK